MSTYDTFGNLGIQLKNGPGRCFHFKVGERIDLSDGIYVGYEGAIVVVDRKIMFEFPSDQVFDKWGGTIDITDANPYKQVVEEIAKEYKTKEVIDG